MGFINYTNYSKEEDLKRLRFVVEAANLFPHAPANVIEIGCGNGNMSYQLARSGHRVIGIDVSEESVRTAREQFQCENLEFRCMAAEEITPDRKFDVILCSEVLEHLYEPLPVLKTISGMMHAGSILILTVPNGKGPRERLITKPVQRMRSNNNLAWKFTSKIKSALGYQGTTVQSSNHSLDHIQFFTLSQLHHMAGECNLTITGLRAANFMESTFPVSLLTRFIHPLQKFDCFIADYLPVTWSSGFYMTLKKV